MKKSNEMIHKLRVRLVIVNMALLLSVVVGIFAGIFTIMYNSEVEQSNRMIEMVLEKSTFTPKNDIPDFPQDFDKERPAKQFEGKDKPKWFDFYENEFIGGVQRNAIIVHINSAGGYNFFYSMMNKDELFSDDTAAALAADKVMSIAKDEGTIRIDEIEYRYLKTVSHGKTAIVFLDRTQEKATINRLLITFIIIGILSISVLLVISIFLAKWAVKPIEVAWEKQRRFVSDASHELRTPLTVIAANTDVVLSNPNDRVKEQAKWLQYIKVETSRILTLSPITFWTLQG